MDKKYERKTWDAIGKREAADAILDSRDPRQAMRELMRSYKLQPYQVYAWIGQAAVARAATAVGKGSEIRAPKVVDLPAAKRAAAAARAAEAEVTADLPSDNDELLRALATAILRKRSSAVS